MATVKSSFLSYVPCTAYKSCNMKWLLLLKHTYLRGMVISYYIERNRTEQSALIKKKIRAKDKWKRMWL